MKLLGGIIEISTISDKQYPGDKSGDSMVATLSGSASKGESAQVQYASGLIGKPPKGTSGVRLRIGSIDIIISHQNYNITAPTNQGETKLYSTDTDGIQASSIELLNDGEVKTSNSNGEMVLNSDGTVKLQSATEDIKTIFSEFLDEIISIQTIGPPSQHVLSPASIANLTALKVRFETLWGD